MRESFLFACETKKQTAEIQDIEKIHLIHVALNQSALFPLSKKTCRHNNHTNRKKKPIPSNFTPLTRLA